MPEYTVPGKVALSCVAWIIGRRIDQFDEILAGGPGAAGPPAKNKRKGREEMRSNLIRQLRALDILEIMGGNA